MNKGIKWTGKNHERMALFIGAHHYNPTALYDIKVDKNAIFEGARIGDTLVRVGRNNYVWVKA